MPISSIALAAAKTGKVYPERIVILLLIDFIMRPNIQQ
jgi:hypothetical protein